jgi:hypothetical protein
VRRTLLILAVPAALAVAAPPAGATVVELGRTSDRVRPTCPSTPCLALTRISTYQGRAGSSRDPFVIPRDGRIVAFTVTLGSPDTTQRDFFNCNFGSPASVRLSVFRRGTRRRTRLNHRLMAQSRVRRVDRYFGASPSFALGEPIRVRRGYIVGVTVPTWAPMLATSLDRTNWWRTSRRRGSCSTVTQRAAAQTVGRVTPFGCTYFRERVMYTVTFVPDPRPTSGS